MSNPVPIRELPSAGILVGFRHRNSWRCNDVAVSSTRYVFPLNRLVKLLNVQSYAQDTFFGQWTLDPPPCPYRAIQEARHAESLAEGT